MAVKDADVPSFYEFSFHPPCPVSDPQGRLWSHGHGDDVQMGRCGVIFLCRFTAASEGSMDFPGPWFFTLFPRESDMGTVPNGLYQVDQIQLHNYG